MLVRDTTSGAPVVTEHRERLLVEEGVLRSPFIPGASCVFLSCSVIPGQRCARRGGRSAGCCGGRRDDDRGAGRGPGVPDGEGAGGWCPVRAGRDGRIQARGTACDHARLGVIEEWLDEIAGPDAIGRLARGTRLGGMVKGTKTRLVTTPFALRGILLTTLMPDADFTEVMTALAGDLAAMPWAAAWHVPSPRVFSAWRQAIGPGPLETVQEAVLRAACAEHQDHDYRDVQVGDLRAGAADGTLTRMPDTPGNRAAFGSAGTADDSAPYPQLRGLLLTDASTRATLGATYGPSGGDKAEAEQ